MILFYSDRQVYADMLVESLCVFLEYEVVHLYEPESPAHKPDLLIVDGLNIHPQRLKKLIRLCGECPVILLSDGQYDCMAVITQLSVNTTVKDLAEICRLVLGQNVVTKKEQLTNIEEYLLAGLAQGHSNKQLSRNYDLSLSSVKYHLQNIYEKMNVHNRAQAALKLQETPL